MGSVIFYGLCRTTPDLRPLLGLGADSSLTSAHILLLAAYGLTFCYVASAPLLVLHAGRFLIGNTLSSSGWRRKMRQVSLLLVPPLLATALMVYCSSASESFSLISAVATFTFLFVLITQLRVILLTLYRENDFFKFYENLASARQTGNSDLIESYRHLREHGNSIAIVLMEVILAGVLFAASKDATTIPRVFSDYLDVIGRYVVICTLWILPGACVLLLAVTLERQFADSQKKR